MAGFVNSCSWVQVTVRALDLLDKDVCKIEADLCKEMRATFARERDFLSSATFARALQRKSHPLPKRGPVD